MEIRLEQINEKARNFVRQGCLSMIQDGPLTPEQYLISPTPVTTGLALISLMTKKQIYTAQIKAGMEYLEKSRNTGGGWGRTPAAESDEKSTEICDMAIECWHKGVTPEVICGAAENIASTWLRDVPRLVLGWPPDSPLLKIIEFFITSETAGNLITDISFENLPVALKLLPPYARPLIIALACIREAQKNRNSKKLISTLKKLTAYQSPHGAWCEDILITSLCVLCLSIAGKYPVNQARGLKWLASVQYQSGAWPSFNQLTNWDIGLAAFTARENFSEGGNFINECAEYLNARANQDGSYGTLSPYSFPDLDDTAGALLGLSSAASSNSSYLGRVDKTFQLILSLQNLDGSWGTFPEVTDNPPYGISHLPAHIKSVDVTIHVLQSLLKTEIDIYHPLIQKALWWLAYQQRWDGSWKSTWYIGNVYATAQALELLIDCGLWPKTRLRARNWLAKAQKENGSWPVGSAGECGLAVTALLKNGEPPESDIIKKGIAYIASLQQPDGSFKPAYGGLYVSGLYYEDPITEALAAVRAVNLYLKLQSNQ